MKIIIIALFIFLLITSVSAEVSQVYGEQNQCVSLRQTCSNCTYVLLTSIQYPNQTVLYINSTMTKTMNDYNYTFCSTDLLGNYMINTCGDLDGSNPCYSPPPYILKITPTGFEVSNSQIILTLIIVGLIFLMALLFFIFGIKSEHPGLKVFSLSFTVMLIVFLIGYVLTMANNFLGEFEFVTNSFSPIYIIFITLLSVGGVGLILYLIYVAFDSFYKYRGLKLS